MKFKPTRMFWILVVSIATAALAITSGVLQYLQSLSDKEEQLEKDKKLIAKQEEVILQSKRIIELTEENRRESQSKSNEIITLQAKHQQELREKTDEINRKNEQLNDLQKESLNYLTGGDKLPRIVPSPGVSRMNSSEVKIELYNQSKYPQYDIDVFITDNFRYQIITKDHPKDYLLGPALFDKVINETGIRKHFDKIEPGGRRLLYSTNLPMELKEGFFLVEIERAAIKKEQTRIEYKHYSGQGDWDLVDIEKHYKNIGIKIE